MKRRDFIKTSMVISAFGTRLPLMAVGRKQRQLGRTSQWESDRIVILIKLNGGNDGLNTVIPIQDDIYYQARPTLAIPSDQTLSLNDMTGLHPSLYPIHPFYQNGQVGIIQGVGYQQGNLSHFRSSDIWVTGSDANEHLTTGWLGRLFENEYPDFPDGVPEHPLAIQYNSANLLEFRTSQSNVGMMVFDPEQMYAIITGNYVPGEDDPAPETYGGEELSYIREIDTLSMEYSEVINESAQAGFNTIEYPENNIGYQMALTAKLISGGLGTPVYRLYQPGYDTHANQANTHDNLLQDVSSSIAALLQDLSNQGLQDRVMVMTTSEFGRRVYENGSLGTDHGTSAPCLFFGSSIVPDIFGDNPDLTNLNNNNNMQVQYDFRQIYSTLIKDWFGLPEYIAQNVFGQSFDPIPFVQEPLSVKPPVLPAHFKVHAAFPNPFNPTTVIGYTLPASGNVNIRIIDSSGRLIQNNHLGPITKGHHTFRVDGRKWASGAYFAQVETGGTILTQKITLLK